MSRKRAVPPSRLFELAQRVHAELADFERALDAGDPKRRSETIAASAARLDALLGDAGFACHDALMRATLPDQVSYRESRGARPPRAAATGECDQLQRVLAACRRAHGSVEDLVSVQAGHDTLGSRLAGKSAFVRRMADDVRLCSLNAVLASSRLPDGAALAAVAELLGRSSVAVGQVIGELSGEINEAVELLGEMSFRTAAGKLLTEVMTAFVGEMIDGADEGGDVGVQLRSLAEGVRDAVERICDSLPELHTRLRVLARQVAALRTSLDVVRALEFNGRLEAARAHADDSVHALFETIGNSLRDADSEIREFDTIDRLAAVDHHGRRRQARAGVADVIAAVAALRAA
jgi:aerotaxis receptor